MPTIDRHIAIQAGWVAGPAFGVAMMAAPEYLHLGPVWSGILFWGGIAVFLLTVAVVVILSLHEEGRRKSVTGPVILMAIGALVFCGGAAWYFWPTSSATRSNGPLSDQEKFRRLMLLTMLREEFKKTHNPMSPNIQAGLENPPAEWVNRHLKDMGETWQIQSVVRRSDDPGFFVECNLVRLPIRMPTSGSLYALNLFPTPLEYGGGGIAEYSGLPDQEIKFGPELMQAYRCQITNYSPKTMISVIIGLDVIFQEQIKDEKNANASHSGNITYQRPWRVDIRKIDPGISNPFILYIWNTTQSFVNVSFRETATAEYIGDSERFEFRVTSANAIPIGLSPMNEPKAPPPAESPK